MKNKIAKNNIKNKKVLNQSGNGVLLLEKEDFSAHLPAVIPQGTDLTVYAPTKQLDPLVAYLREINKYELLSREQEQGLTKALFETGDIEVAKKLVLHNLRLVVKIAMDYRSVYQNVMDLIQEGNIGLMKAVSKFDPNQGTKLSYYASWWIKSYILKFILDNFRLIKIGTTNEQKKLFYNLLKEKERLSAMGIVPDIKMISENLGVSEKAVTIMEERLGSSGSEVSMDVQIADDSATTLGDMLSDENISFEEDVESKQGVDILKKHLNDFLNDLNERDRKVFEKRLLAEVPVSLQTIADEYGVSRERIRQIEERLISKLKVYMSEFIR